VLIYVWGSIIWFHSPLIFDFNIMLMFFGFLAFLKLFGFPLFRLLVYIMKVISGVRVTRSLVLCVCFVDRCLSLCPFFLLIIVLSVLRCTDSDYLPLVSSDSSYSRNRFVGHYGLWRWRSVCCHLDYRVNMLSSQTVIPRSISEKDSGQRYVSEGE
jgi:hypothetical protein